MCRSESRGRTASAAAPTPPAPARNRASSGKHGRHPGAARRRSGLSALLRTLSDHPNTEARVDAELAGLADRAMEAMHDQSEKYRPNLADLSEGVPDADRRETMDWCIQAFDVVGFSDAMLFQCALLLDRFYAKKARGSMSMLESQQALLAAVVLSIKAETRDEIRFPLRQVVSHLGRDKVAFEDVMRAETRLLQPLGYCVSTPTSFEFLEVLGTRMTHFDGRIRGLAEFLLQLTLADAVVHWAHAHAVLAASALALAALTLQAPADAISILLEDLRVCCPHFEEPANEMVACCADLHALWVQSTSTETLPISSFARHLRTKFARRDPGEHPEVANIPPPAGAPVLVAQG